jgi:hypothetical protein
MIKVDIFFMVYSLFSKCTSSPFDKATNYLKITVR